MKVLSIIALLGMTSPAMACSSLSEKGAQPFAVAEGNSQWQQFKVFAPKQHDVFFLTSIYLHKENAIYTSLHFKDAPSFPNYKEAFIELDVKSVNDYELYFSYTTTQDGKLISCAGNTIKTGLTAMLEGKRPQPVPPPAQFPETEH